MAIEHNTLTGSELHEVKGASTANANQVLVADGAGTTYWDDPNNVYNAADFTAERVLEAESTAVSQGPTALDTIHQVEFGAAQFTGAEPVMIATDGTITFNEAGLYSIKTLFHFTRAGGAGTSVVHFRGVVNDAIQGGFTLTLHLDNSSAFTPFEDIVNLDVPAGTTLHFEMYRDSSGDNSGVLQQSTPSLSGGGPLDWKVSPSALVRVERFIPKP